MASKALRGEPYDVADLYVKALVSFTGLLNFAVCEFDCELAVKVHRAAGLLVDAVCR